MDYSPRPRYSAPMIPLGAKALDTNIKFQDALLTLLATEPWRKVTMRGVAKLTGMAAGSIYNYYPHLDALALATAQRLEKEGWAVPAHLAHVVRLLAFEESTLSPAAES